MHFVWQIDEHLKSATACNQWHVWFILCNDVKSFYSNDYLKPYTWFQMLIRRVLNMLLYGYCFPTLINMIDTNMNCIIYHVIYLFCHINQFRTHFCQSCAKSQAATYKRCLVRLRSNMFACILSCIYWVENDQF